MLLQSAVRSLFLAACLVAAPLSAIADEGTPPSGADMMGHSPASKEHTLMKPHKGGAASATETPAASDNGMGHSPASKEHTLMKPHKGGAAGHKSAKKKYNMMGHSPASKEHILMQRKPAAKNAKTPSPPSP